MTDDLSYVIVVSCFFLPQSTASGGRGSEGEEEEEEGEERRKAAGLKMLLREKTAEAVGKTWPSHSETQGQWLQRWF